jgi:hypothetical protein
VVVDTNAPKAARRARTLLEPVGREFDLRTNAKTVTRGSLPGKLASSWMPWASLHSSMLEKIGDARGGSPPMIAQPVRRPG